MGGGFKHLVIVKFKEGSEVEEILKGIEKLVADIDIIKAFEWGQDLEGAEMLTQGFTHSFTMTFDSKEDYIAFQTHPKHVEYSATFSAVIDKIVVLTFPSVQLKPSPPPPPAVEAADAAI
ncbi:Stress responsive A/B Barrel Domain [Euphorbia peplus]|nr:Stress responsive A/B Barrel Domain [Euphorbia peplus]